MYAVPNLSSRKRVNETSRGNMVLPLRQSAEISEMGSFNGGVRFFREGGGGEGEMDGILLSPYTLGDVRTHSAVEIQ